LRIAIQIFIFANVIFLYGYWLNSIKNKSMKKFVFFAVAILISCNMMAQSLDKMQWFNEPEKWEIKDNRLSMFVTPQSDYWRISHYGFTVDDAPFYYATYGGEFEVKVKISGDYKVRFDQSGLMLRTDHQNYIKAGIEFVDGKYNLSTVVTHKTSDWSVITLDKPVPFVWIKAVRRLDAVEVFYSFDDKNYVMMRNAWLQDNCPVMVGVMGACPDGNGFEAKFENFSVKHLPDQRRLKWLQDNAE
jgi:regulation of enolase protein 1 (concanavalin A-like superfamily)